MIREVEYDEVFDSQKHFRSVLDSMARPGKINSLDSVPVDPPADLQKSSTLVCFALLNRDTSFYFAKGSYDCEEYLKMNTGARSTQIEDADFLILDGNESSEIVELAKEGVLTYPELSATFILQVTGLSSSPEAGMVGIDITGPGVKESATVYVGGLNPGWVDSLMEKNSEFPLGVDAILVADSANGTPEVMCLPRTSSLKIIN